MSEGQVVLKRCRECRASKPLESFPLQKQGRLGRHPLCKACRAAQERSRYARNREEILEAARTDDRRKQRVRWRALARKYGLGRHEHETLFVAQRGCCAICERRHAVLVVDHDHRTGMVRGLLCVNCNFALGELRDDPTRCESAAQYLMRQR
ncbi:MAG: endonuclease domain-containing protein [Actinomycetota bacterium]